MREPFPRLGEIFIFFGEILPDFGEALPGINNVNIDIVVDTCAPLQDASVPF